MLQWERVMKRIGKLARRYKFFFLNPYQDVRFSYCPKCASKTKLRKVPLVIQVESRQPLALNKSCRYCPSCDLLIAHRDEVEEQLSSLIGQRQSLESSNIIGTIERSEWQRNTSESMTSADILDGLYLFKQVLKFEPSTWIKLNVQWKGLES